MRDFFDQVEAARKHQLYFLAIAGALVIPDICGAMESADGQQSERRFKAWFRGWVRPKYVPPPADHFLPEGIDLPLMEPSREPWFDETDCWQLRCSLLHQGRSVPHHRGARYVRFVFVEAPPGLQVHRNRVDLELEDGQLEHYMHLDAEIFIQDMVESGRAWLGAVEGTENFHRNLPLFLRGYPGGLGVSEFGLPEIA